MEKITVDTWSWDNVEKRILQEKRCVAKIEDWAKKESPPVDIGIDCSCGSIVSVYPPLSGEINDNEKHKLLAWFVRNSKKKFLRDSRESGAIYWWNASHGKDIPFDNDNFNDDAGKFIMTIMIENAAIGNCKLVEKERVVKYKELVCE